MRKLIRILKNIVNSNKTSSNSFMCLNLTNFNNKICLNSIRIFQIYKIKVTIVITNLANLISAITITTPI